MPGQGFFADDEPDREPEAPTPFDEEAVNFEQFVIKRTVTKTPAPDVVEVIPFVPVQIEAQVGAEMTFVQFWRELANNREESGFCYIDGDQPELILDVIEDFFKVGHFYAVCSFFMEHRTARNAIELRLQLEAELEQLTEGLRKEAE